MTRRPLARCATHPDRDWLWHSDRTTDQAYAVAICHRCPLEQSCRERGRSELEGVWGGTTPADRFELLEPQPTVAEHVASRGCFVAGCRRPECRAANTAYIAQWRSSRKAAVTARETVGVAGPMPLRADSRRRACREQQTFDWSVA